MSTPIPEKHIEFCKEVARLAISAKLTRFCMTFKPGFDDEWSDEILLNWDAGRHGGDMKNLRVSSTVTVFGKVDLT